MKQGVVLDWDCVGPDILPTILTDLPIHWEIHKNTESHQIDERLAGKEVAVVGKVRLQKENLTRAERLKLICEMATGYDNIDVAASNELGITVSNVPAYSTDSVAQLTLFLMLSLLSNAPTYINAKEQWPKSSLICLFKGEIYEAKNISAYLNGRVQNIVR